MKLLYILNEIQYSGAEIMIRGSAAFFCSQGFELHALCTGEVLGDYAPRFTQAQICLKHIPFQKNIFFFIRVYQYMVRKKFDVVHIHTERAFVFYALAARLARISCVLRTIHNVFLFKGFLRFQRYVMRRVCHTLLRVKSIAVSASVFTVEKKYYHNPTHLVWNWVDDSRFYPSRSNNEKKSARTRFDIPETAFVLCTAGACTKVKNHVDILNAMALLSPEFEDIYFLHLGDGKLNLKEKQMARELNLETRVVFAGQVENVREAFIASDLFVMPSQYEGLGLSCLEAAACGLPALVYDVWGLKDIVKHGVSGFICPPVPHDLAEKIKRLHRDRILLEQLAENSITHSSKKFSARRSLETLLELYTRNPPLKYRAGSESDRRQKI